MFDGRHPARRAASAQLAQSGVVTATTLWVLAAASAFAWILVREWVPQMLGEWIGGAGAGRAGFLAMTVVLFVVIGALLEGLPALLIFGPILFPISRTVGIDPVHYGIVIIAAMGIAFFLPPVGVGLSIAAGIARVDIDEVSRNVRAVSGRAAHRAGADRGVPGAHARPAEDLSRLQGLTSTSQISGQLADANVPELRRRAFGFEAEKAGSRVGAVACRRFPPCSPTAAARR